MIVICWAHFALFALVFVQFLGLGPAELLPLVVHWHLDCLARFAEQLVAHIVRVELTLSTLFPHHQGSGI